MTPYWNKKKKNKEILKYNVSFSTQDFDQL